VQWQFIAVYHGFLMLGIVGLNSSFVLSCWVVLNAQSLRWNNTLFTRRKIEGYLAYHTSRMPVGINTSRTKLYWILLWAAYIQSRPILGETAIR
jgi:hypothetical protein